MIDKAVGVTIVNRTAFPLNIAIIAPFTHSLPLRHTNGLEPGEYWKTEVPFVSNVLFRRTAVHIRYDHEDNRFRGRDKLMAIGSMSIYILAGLLGCLWTSFATARYLRIILNGGNIRVLRLCGDVLLLSLLGSLLHHYIQSTRRGTDRKPKGHVLSARLEYLPPYGPVEDLELAICWQDGKFILWDKGHDQLLA